MNRVSTAPQAAETPTEIIGTKGNIPLVWFQPLDGSIHLSADL